MEDLKIIYGIVLAIWKLFKKYGTKRLDERQWGALLGDSNALRRQAKQQGEEWYLLFYDLWIAVRNYYTRKEPEYEEKDGR